MYLSYERCVCKIVCSGVSFTERTVYAEIVDDQLLAGRFTDSRSTRIREPASYPGAKSLY